MIARKKFTVRLNKKSNVVSKRYADLIERHNFILCVNIKKWGRRKNLFSK
ncbi:IS1 family transposase [Serratia sp. UGAL515B_01]